MKKLICFLLVLTMLAGMSVFASADGEMLITLTPNSKNVNKGDEVQFAVKLNSNPGLAGIEFSVKFDEEVLEWTNVLPGDESLFPGNWDIAPGVPVTWYNNTDKNCTSNGVFCTLVFKVKDNAKLGQTMVELLFKEDSVYMWAGDDNHEEDVPFIPYQGKVTVNMEDGYYLLVGHGDDGWTVNNINWLQKFEPNPANTSEYMLTTALAEKDEIKVVRVENNEITGWWPDGEDTQYHVDLDHSGNVTIFFQTGYVDAWAEFGGYFFIQGVVKPAKSADVYGCNLNLNGTIGLNIYLIPSEALLADNDAYVTLGGQKFIIKDAPTRIVGDDTLYQFTVNKAAKEMNDEVGLKLYDGAGNQLSLFRHSEGGIVPQTGFSYSVQTYIGKSLANPKSTDALKALMNAMSDYGSAAQAQFGWNIGNRAPITGNLDAVTAALLSDYQMTSSGDLTGAKVNSASLVVDSGTTLIITFLIPVDGDECTFTVDGQEVTPVADDPVYTVSIPNIVAKDLDRTFTVEVKNGDESLTAKFSALSYAYAVLSKDDSPDTLQDLVKALYLYNKAANEYFGG